MGKRPLARATFTGESGSGWQQVNFSSPVAITANTVYVASYFSPTGDFAVDRNYFNAAVNNPPLQALQDGGVYNYGSSSAFPTTSFSASNYWVDVVFNGSDASGGSESLHDLAEHSDAGDNGRESESASRIGGPKVHIQFQLASLRECSFYKGAKSTRAPT